MEKTNTRTFLVTVSPYDENAPAPTADGIDRLLSRALGSAHLIVVSYQVPAAGRVSIDFAMNQRVCNRSDGKIGRIYGLNQDSEGQLYARVLLEEPYISKAWKSSDGQQFPETRSYHCNWPVWEMQAIADGGKVEEDQRKLAESCAPWFEVQA